MAYLRRILSVYLFAGRGPLAFWYEIPEVNEHAFTGEFGEYYMTFRGKAAYSGPFDAVGVPLLDYRGNIGRQHNPIAIAQYGLACYNRHRRTADVRDRQRCLHSADWLVAQLKPNAFGVPAWHHYFNWPYRQMLVAPWYSGLAQGQGISLLLRAATLAQRSEYTDAAAAAFQAFRTPVDKGGVVMRDADGLLWIEEYLVEPPSHILNGFIWALWGVYDFWKSSGDETACTTFHESVETLARNLDRYDTGSWSLYDFPNFGPPMVASLYYHRLHVVQLRVLARLTHRDCFDRCADRWERYAHNNRLVAQAFGRKVWFKLHRY